MAFNWPANDLTVPDKVGIGTEAPVEKLEVKGNIKLNTGVAIGEFSNDGTFLVASDQSSPTTLAVKTYVGMQVATVNASLSDKADKNGSLTHNFQANNLAVQGNLDVTGTTTFRNIEQHQGDLELGNEDTDQVRIHGVVRSTHTSRVLQVESPMKVNGTITADRVGIGTPNPIAALHVMGHLLGAAQDTAGNALRICCGATPEGNTAWQDYNNNGTGVFVDVDTSMCRFSTTPIYIVNMHGSSYNWETTGGSSAYSRSATGFRVYVRFSDGRQLTPAFANSAGWHIQWVAIGN